MAGVNGSMTGTFGSQPGTRGWQWQGEAHAVCIGEDTSPFEVRSWPGDDGGMMGKGCGRCLCHPWKFGSWPERMAA